VDATGSYFQFGLRLSASAQGNASTVSLYYADEPPVSGHWDSPAVVWTTPSLVGRWTSIIVRAKSRRVSLYVDCHAQSPLDVAVDQRQNGLTFDNGSVVYVAQGGPRFGHHFEVRMLVLRVVCIDLTVACRCLEPSTFSNKVRSGPVDMPFKS